MYFKYYIVLKLKLRTILRPLTFNHPLTSLACHGVQMWVRSTVLSRSTCF